MKHMLIVLALTATTDARAQIVMSANPVLVDDMTLSYPRPVPVKLHCPYPGCYPNIRSQRPEYGPGVYMPVPREPPPDYLGEFYRWGGRQAVPPPYPGQIRRRCRDVYGRLVSC